MLLNFEYSLYFGPGDIGECCVEVEITEEECAKLKEAEASGEDFRCCKSVKDIYNRIYDLADANSTHALIADEILSQDKKASDMYRIEVFYPYFPKE